MTCPVCGLPDATTPCTRCGTDLEALAAPEGRARLEIVAVAAKGRPARGPAGPTQAF